MVRTAFMLLAFAVLAAAETPGDRMVAEYFRAETEKITEACLKEVQSREDWMEQRGEYRRQLRDMLGLEPLPERTPLKPVITGSVEHEAFRVENLHFQSRPGLYVTANFYLPKKVEGRLPAILYVCGHGRVKKNGISYGNKTHYRHHAAWFARNGYACLIIDTLQLGEIEGLHHGTYREGRWWWNARGYTPAGVEAWNSIRAIDYLQSRPEVDPERIGITGRSGGGAYSWWTAALDDRVKVAVPVAGIASLKNHVVDGCVEGHCDCMYMLNSYRWDFAQVAALVAPRPLLISNTDSDGIFPLDGVVDVYNKTRRIYKLLGAEKQVGLHITHGPHQDTQELRIHAFRWFEQHLKGLKNPPLIETAAHRFLEPEQLKVFKELPEDEINTRIDESFVAQGPRKQPDFRGWPARPSACTRLEPPVDMKGWRLESWSLDPGGPPALRAGLPDAPGKVKTLRLHVLEEQVDEKDWPKKFSPSGDTVHAVLYPTGTGALAWSPGKATQNRRRFMLLGQTWHEKQVWDIRRAILTLRKVEALKHAAPVLEAKGLQAENAGMAALFEEGVRLDIQAPESPMAVYLNHRRARIAP